MTDTRQEPHGENTDPARPKASFSFGLAIGLGAGIGAGLGSAFDNVAVGVAVGAGIGVAIDVARQAWLQQGNRQPPAHKDDTQT